MTIEELGKALSRKKAPIKAVLLDQNGPYCGIGQSSSVQDSELVEGVLTRI